MSQDSMRVTVSGRRITERDLRRGTKINYLAGSLGMMWAAVALGMPLTMLFEALGADNAWIGWIGTINQVALAAQIPGAFVMERLSGRKFFWCVTATIHRALWFAPAFLAILPPGQMKNAVFAFVLIAALSAILGQTVSSAWHSWMADLIPEAQRGRFWGRRQSYVFAAYLIATWISGYILDAYRLSGHVLTGFALVFTAAGFVGCADILIHGLVPEPRPRPRANADGAWARILAPLQERNFLWITLAFGVWLAGIGVVGAFGQVYLKREFHVSYSDLAWLVISSSVGTILTSYIWGYVIDRIGARAFGAIMMVAGPLFGVAWFLIRDGTPSLPELVADWPILGSLAAATTRWIPGLGALHLPQSIWVHLLSGLFAGGLYSGVGLSQLNLLAAYAPRHGRTMAMAVHWTVVGLLGALGPLVGGYLADWIAAQHWTYHLPTGTRFGFIHVLVLLHMGLAWFVAMPLLLRARGKPGEMPVQTALSRLLVVNPLRAAGSIYNIYMMSAAVSRVERARAARELGEHRTAIAVSDLIARLDDPSAEVREEAVFALGAIGSPDAVDALVAKLDDPNAALAPQIAKALRQARDPRTLKPLLGKLADPDRETRTETARTLGELGDRRAARSLLDVLRASTDDKVVLASSEALARLGEIAAIYSILPRMRSTRNPILKRSLAVAVGELLGEREEFYKILVSEMETRGGEAARLLKELRTAIRDVARNDLLVQGEALIARTGEIEAAYEDEDPRRCADLLFDLAIGLAALGYGVKFGGNAEVFVEELIWRHERFGVAVWFLSLVRADLQNAEGDSVSADATDVLLGLYVLSRWRATDGV